jgi:hypothetical protein
MHSQLVTQQLDCGVHHVATARFGVAPDVREQLLAGDDPILAFSKVLEDVELLTRPSAVIRTRNRPESAFASSICCLALEK